MNNNADALLALAQTYFDAAYEMDADKFAAIFHRSSTVTKIGEDGEVNTTPIESWLAAVRTLKSPKQLGADRQDAVLSLDIVNDLAHVKLTLQLAPRRVTDMLSCLKVGGSWVIVQKVMTAEPL